MDKKFDFNKVAEHSVKILIVNFLWIVCSIPVITAGASTCAAFYVLLKVVGDEEVNIFKGFFKSFKQNFVQGTIAWVFTVPCGYALYLMWKIIFAGDGNFFGIVGTVIFSILAALVFVYLYAMIARYTNSLKKIFKNSLGVALQYFGQTIITIFAVVILGIIFSLGKWTMFAGILIGPGLIFYIIAKSAKNIFNNLEANQSTEE